MLNEIEKTYAYLQFRLAGMNKDESIQAIDDLEFLILMDQFKSLFTKEVVQESKKSTFENVLKSIFS
ncbi:hypothetical protein [Bacillus sp. Bos-x628]|uniref:hypothetical protein n=1 Tax=Bacillus maqinnsis TaxID=3229854 RepID=UPI00338F9C5C